MRHYLEFQLLRAALFALDRLSYEAACGVIRRMADVWWLVDWERRRVARENILASGIETDPVRARALGRRAAQHVGLVVIESLKSAEILGEERWRDHVRLDIPDDVMAALEDPTQGMILASGHFGNWEIAAQLLSHFKPVAGITTPMKNAAVEDLVRRRKPRYRFRPIPKFTGDPTRLFSVLKEGEILALLTDQHARSLGVPVDFFGRPAQTFKTAAMLHLVTRAPLCFAACRRTAPMHFELSVSPFIQHPPTGDRQADVLAILGTVNRYLENAIREAPDQYLWGHRRWRA